MHVATTRLPGATYSLGYEDPVTGFIPNKIFATAPGKTWRDYPEVLNFNRPEIGTSYAQPPLEAWAAWEMYEAYYCRRVSLLEWLQETLWSARW